MIGTIDSPIPQNIQFLRPKDFLNKVQLYDDGIEPTDIKQGCLGDCYFLASLAALSEKPKTIQKMIKSLGNGKYEINIFFKGKERKVIIDDVIPCVNGIPFFSHNHGDELWVMLLEKAYAKLHKNYGNMEGGMPFVALSDLTGMPVKRFLTKDLDKDELFKRIMKYDKKDYYMCANVPDVPDVDLQKDYGLVEEHCYTVIGAYEIEGHKLLKIRNPWGECEWKGKWRDDDPNWTASMKKELNVVEANDGLYFMEIDDFVKHFEDLVVVYYKEEWKHFGTKRFEMKSKQMAIDIEAEGDCIFSLQQSRKGEKIGMKMWCVNSDNICIGGLTEKAFTNATIMKGRKVKISSKGKYRIIVETHSSFVAKLPLKFTICGRSKHPIQFSDPVALDGANRIPYIDKQQAETSERCPACKQIVPEKGVARTKIGTYHIKCFVCSACGQQLSGKFGMRGDKILCPDCFAKK